MTRRHLWVLLGLVTVVALAFGASTTDARTPDERLRSIGGSLRCPTCAGQAVASSDAPAARAIRAQILADIEAGRSDDAIRARLTATYGDDILLTPPRQGFAGLVWTVPVMVVILGFAGVAVAFRRWGRDTSSGPSRRDRALVAAALGGEAVPEEDLGVDPDDPHGEGSGR